MQPGNVHQPMALNRKQKQFIAYEAYVIEQRIGRRKIPSSPPPVNLWTVHLQYPSNPPPVHLQFPSSPPPVHLQSTSSPPPVLLQSTSDAPPTKASNTATMFFIGSTVVYYMERWYYMKKWKEKISSINVYIDSKE